MRRRPLVLLLLLLLSRVIDLSESIDKPHRRRRRQRACGAGPPNNALASLPDPPSFGDHQETVGQFDRPLKSRRSSFPSERSFAHFAEHVAARGNLLRELQDQPDDALAQDADRRDRVQRLRPLPQTARGESRRFAPRQAGINSGLWVFLREGRRGRAGGRAGPGRAGRGN